MSIKRLEEYKDNYQRFKFSASIEGFMKTTIDTFKDQSDMIAGLRKQLAEKMKADDQKESYMPRKEIKIGLTDLRGEK